MIFQILYLHHETELAFKLSRTGREADGFAWCPAVHCTITRRHVCALGDAQLVDVTMPEWLARAKGLA